MARELTELELEELEAKKLQNELARLELTKLRAEVETRTNNKKRGAEDARKAIEDRNAVRARCNHRPGGEAGMAIAQGQGDMERPTCIGGQQFLDERIRLVCGRCGDECFSDDPNRERWAFWVNLWKHSINKQMMIVGGLKFTKQPQLMA